MYTFEKYSITLAYKEGLNWSSGKRNHINYNKRKKETWSSNAFRIGINM